MWPQHMQTPQRASLTKGSKVQKALGVGEEEVFLFLKPPGLNFQTRHVNMQYVWSLYFAYFPPKAYILLAVPYNLKKCIEQNPAFTWKSQKSVTTEKTPFV